MNSELLITREGMQQHMAQSEDEGMTRHMVDAIAINLRRGFGYAKLTKGRSLLLSMLLIASEISMIIPAYLFDLWGKKYNRLGIRVIAADFISMSRIKKFGTPLKFKGRLPKGDFKDLQYQMKNYASTASQLLAENNFSMVAAHTHHMLTQVEAMERFHCALLPMSRHILESIGFASLNALKYEDQSQKRTNRLCRWMIQFQISGLPLTLPADALAQRLHQMDAGIVENDVPYIPFHEAYEQFAKA